MSSGITFFYLTGIILYLIATFFFAATIRDKYSKSKSPMAEKIGLVITIVGFISHIVYFILRWIAGGHAPVSNMFEYVTFLAISIVLAFLILYFIYRADVRSEEHTSELQSRGHLVCRLLLEKKNKKIKY